jgi:hypothetical protein
MGSGQEVRCIECGQTAAAGGKGWRALIATDPENDDELPHVVVYCADCALREFGPVRR